MVPSAPADGMLCTLAGPYWPCQPDLPTPIRHQEKIVLFCVLCVRSDGPADGLTTPQLGGYLRGRAKPLVALRDGAPSASVLGWQSSRLPTEHMPWPMSCRTAALDPVRGTHKGHQCQEGVRTWPGDYARRRAGLDCSSGSFLAAAGPSRRAARSQAGAPAAAQRRGRTSLTPASGGRSSRGRKGPVAVGLSGVVCWFPVRGWRSDLTSTHPAPP
jgi:hypothetical protein